MIICLPGYLEKEDLNKIKALYKKDGVEVDFSGEWNLE